MSFSSKVLYTGDGVVESFSVPMPYISSTHIFVYVNEILQISGMQYTWSTPSTILFSDAPGVDAAIEIKRWTSPTATLVDFANGSVLNESDLDTAYLHSFYLSQEYADSFTELINNAFINVATGAGIIETETDLIIAALVNEMLNLEAAATIQQRVIDIDTNAEAIITLGEGLQTQINTLAEGVAALVYVQATEPVPGVDGVPDPIIDGSRWYDSDDNNKPYIYQSGAWVLITDPRIGVAAANISILQVEMDNVISAIVEEQFVRSTETDSLAQTMSIIGAQSADGQSFIVDLNTTRASATETLADRFSTLSASIASNADGIATNVSDIITEQTARSNGDSTNASAITALDSRLVTAEGTISTSSSAISLLQTDVTTAQGDITGNTAGINANAATISTNASAITALDSRLTTAEGTVSGQSSAISLLQTDVTAVEGVAGQNTTDITTNAAAIVSVQSAVDLKPTTFRQAGTPTALATGDLWVRSTDNALFRWDGATWVSCVDTGIAANASAVSGLQTQITANDGDISANASAITTLQTDVSTVTGDLATSNINISNNAAAIVTAQGDIITNASSISSLSSSITTVDGRVDSANIIISANTSAISTAESDITALEARYGVALDVNGYVSGFVLNNSGTSSSFVILADKFAVVTPTTLWTSSTVFALGDTVRPTTPNGYVYECTTAGTSGGGEPTWTTTPLATEADGSVVWTCYADSARTPFTIAGDKIRLQGDVEIDGSLMLNGTIIGSALIAGTIGSTQIGPNAITTNAIGANQITANHIVAGTITATEISVTNLQSLSTTTGTLTIDSAGHIKGGQTAYNTGAGFFLGYDTSAYKFSIGNSATGNYLTWDGSTLTIKGNVFVGEYIPDATIELLTANTERTVSTLNYVTRKTFTIDRAGTVRVRCQFKRDGGLVGNIDEFPLARVQLNGVTIGTGYLINTTSYSTETEDVTVVADDVITIDGYGGLTIAAQPVLCYIANASIRGTVTIPADGGTVDLD